LWERIFPTINMPWLEVFLLASQDRKANFDAMLQTATQRCQENLQRITTLIPDLQKEENETEVTQVSGRFGICSIRACLPQKRRTAFGKKRRACETSSSRRNYFWRMNIIAIAFSGFLRDSSEIPQRFLRDSSKIPQRFLRDSSEIPCRLRRESLGIACRLLRD
jgi:hypothetical protein